jgi:hypothetical protein
LFGEVGWKSPLKLTRVSLRLSTASTSVDNRSADFGLLAGRLMACPVSLLPASAFDLLPCATLEIGRLTGQGESSAALPNPKSSSIFWSSLGALLLLRWHVTPLMTFELGGEVGFPLVRHTFIFEWPTQVVAEIPAAGAGVTAGVTARFH